MRNALIAVALTSALVSGPTYASGAVDVATSYALDIAESGIATAVYAATHPETFCPTGGKGSGTPGVNFTPPLQYDEVSGFDLVVAAATCPLYAGHVAMLVTVEYHVSGRRWDEAGSTTCSSPESNDPISVPVTVPPCTLAQFWSPGGFADPDPAYGKCRRARLEIVEPQGQPRSFTGLWGCTTGLVAVVG